MKIVNLRTYPKFWKEFLECLAKYDDLNYAIKSSSRTTYLLQEKFNLYASVPFGSDFTHAEMEEDEYIMFVLRWS